MKSFFNGVLYAGMVIFLVLAVFMLFPLFMSFGANSPSAIVVSLIYIFACLFMSALAWVAYKGSKFVDNIEEQKEFEVQE